MYIYNHDLFHYALLQDIESSSLCYTVRPCCLSILCAELNLYFNIYRSHRCSL